jgi:hypothetical protein
MLRVRYMALAGAGLLALACGGATRDEAGTIIGPGNVSALELHVGDCFNDPSDTEAQVSSLAAVPCDDAHDNQVFALIDYTASDEAFPGQQALLDFSNEACTAPFSSFVGTTYAESRFVISALLPSADSWDQGDREVVCLLYDSSLESWTGTAEGRAE